MRSKVNRYKITNVLAHLYRKNRWNHHWNHTVERSPLRHRETSRSSLKSARDLLVLPTNICARSRP